MHVGFAPSDGDTMAVGESKPSRRTVREVYTVTATATATHLDVLPRVLPV